MSDKSATTGLGRKMQHDVINHNGSAIASPLNACMSFNAPQLL